MPAAKVPPISEVAGKWQRRASAAGPDYETGVRNPAQDWAAASVAANQSYQQGVTQAIARNAYGKGVQATGTSAWQQASIEKGPARYAQGVTIGQGAFEKNAAPFLEAIGRVDLPPRGPAGSEANLQRMLPIPRALAQLKRR